MVTIAVVAVGGILALVLGSWFIFGVVLGVDERELEVQAESAARNAGLEVEAAAIGSGGRYPDELQGVIEDAGPWPVDFTVASSSPEEFCIETSHPQLPDRGAIAHYDSDGGGFGEGPCP